MFLKNVNSVYNTVKWKIISTHHHTRGANNFDMGFAGKKTRRKQTMYYMQKKPTKRLK